MAVSPSATRRSTTAARVIAVQDGAASTRQDRLAGEEPLEIRAAGPGQDAVSVAVTMRTPGNDFELAAGFLFTEGLIASQEEIATIGYCETEPAEQQYNVVTVELRRPFDPGSLQRNFYASSSCGVCGKASIDMVEVNVPPLPPGPELGREAVAALPGGLRSAQSVFERTGGLHATGLFEAGGALVSLREDVGRHNAMDKLIGEQLLAGNVPLREGVALVSGRASFELVQKAGVAGIPVLCAISAPTSLAVEAARRYGMTLVGFVREGRFNVYAGAERIAGLH